jgi:hypothetical protein
MTFTQDRDADVPVLLPKYRPAPAAAFVAPPEWAPPTGPPLAIQPALATEPPPQLLPSVRDQASAVQDLARISLLVVAALALALVAQFLVISGFQHRAAQQGAFDQFRKELALGTAPLGSTDAKGNLLPLGTPIAIIDISSIGIHEVVLEGTTSGVLMAGPGHSRNTPFPGLAGTTEIFGRQASYGGPFSRINQLRRNAKVVVTTSEGVSTYRVLDVRHGGDPTPSSVASGGGRLVLITADGTRFVPSGVLRVDADLVTPALPGAASSVVLGHSERVMAGDTSTVWALVLWLQALIVIAVASVWSWKQWGRQQTWIVFLPLVALGGYFASTQFVKLLPNLL